MVGVATTVAVVDGVLVLVVAQAGVRVCSCILLEGLREVDSSKEKVETSLCMQVLLSETTAHRCPRMSRQMGMRCVMGSFRNTDYWYSVAHFRG